MLDPTQFERLLAEIRYRDPFRPSYILLSDGMRLQIDKPEALCYHAGLAAFIDGSGRIHFFTHQTTYSIETSA